MRYYLNLQDISAAQNKFLLEQSERLNAHNKAAYPSKKEEISARAEIIEDLAAYVRKPENANLAAETFGSCCETGIKALEQLKQWADAQVEPKAKKKDKTQSENQHNP